MNLSLARPLPIGIGRVSQYFGEHPEWYSKFGQAGHNGIDYATALGTPILAAHNGVCTIGWDRTGYGNYVRIDGDVWETIYAHMSLVEVRTGDTVLVGDIIGRVGSTGNSTGNHLHFGARLRGMRNPAYSNYIDPVPFRDI